MTLTVELGRVNLTLNRLADLKPGDVLELGRHSREPVELTSGGRLVARGELILIDTELGVRVTHVFFSECGVRPTGTLAAHRVNHLDQRLEGEGLQSQQAGRDRQGHRPAPQRSSPGPAAVSRGGRKSIQSRATSPMFRPTRFMRQRTASVIQAARGTDRGLAKPTAHQTADGSPIAIASSTGLTASQAR